MKRMNQGQQHPPPPLSTGLIVYLGMMVGAFLWGGLADRIGRRQSLLISLSINSVFSFFSSFVQGYSTFLFCRLLSGVGSVGARVKTHVNTHVNTHVKTHVNTQIVVC